STSKLKFLSFDELGSYSSSFDEFYESDESSSLERSVSGSLQKSVSHKGPSKDLKIWYEDEKDEDEEEKDEEEDEKDED
nr:hypothetical protein [Tanacetum cinerariifolium]